jgi:hypothetical protein
MLFHKQLFLYIFETANIYKEYCDVMLQGWKNNPTREKY